MRRLLTSLLLGFLSLPASAEEYPRPTLDLGVPRAEGTWSSHIDGRTCVLLGPRLSGRMSARTAGDRVVALGRMPDGPGGGMGLLLLPTPVQPPSAGDGGRARLRVRAGGTVAEGEAVRLRGFGIFVRLPREGVEALVAGVGAGAALELVGPVGASWSARGGAEAAARTLACLRR